MIEIDLSVLASKDKLSMKLYLESASMFKNKNTNPSSYHKDTTEFSHARRSTTPAIKDSENGRCSYSCLNVVQFFPVPKGLAYNKRLYICQRNSTFAKNARLLSLFIIILRNC